MVYLISVVQRENWRAGCFAPWCSTGLEHQSPVDESIVPHPRRKSALLLVEQDVAFLYMRFYLFWLFSNLYYSKWYMGVAAQTEVQLMRRVNQKVDQIQAWRWWEDWLHGKISTRSPRIWDKSWWVQQVNINEGMVIFTMIIWFRVFNDVYHPRIMAIVLTRGLHTIIMNQLNRLVGWPADRIAISTATEMDFQVRGNYFLSIFWITIFHFGGTAPKNVA